MALHEQISENFEKRPWEPQIEEQFFRTFSCSDSQTASLPRLVWLHMSHMLRGFVNWSCKYFFRMSANSLVHFCQDTLKSAKNVTQNFDMLLTSDDRKKAGARPWDSIAGLTHHVDLDWILWPDHLGSWNSKNVHTDQEILWHSNHRFVASWEVILVETTIQWKDTTTIVRLWSW